MKKIYICLCICICLFVINAGVVNPEPVAKDDPRLIELQTEYQKLIAQKTNLQLQVTEIDRQLLRLEGRFNERMKMIEPLMKMIEPLTGNE